MDQGLALTGPAVGALPGAAQDLAGVLGAQHGLGDRRRDGGEDAAAHGDQDGGEGQADGAGPGAGDLEVLDDLGDVAVHAPDGVGLGGAQGLGGHQVGLEGLARPGVADGEDGGDLAGVDEFGGDAGLGGQGHGGDIASGHGDPPGGGQQAALRAGLALAVVQELGHAVGPGAGVLGAVEGAPGGGVGQAVVGPAVDEEGGAAGARRAGLQGGRDLAGGAVRQGQDDDVVIGQALDVGGLDGAVRQGDEVRVVAAQDRSGRGPGGQGADLDAGVGRQEAEDLAPRVSGRTGDRCCPRHAGSIRAGA